MWKHKSEPAQNRLIKISCAEGRLNFNNLFENICIYILVKNKITRAHLLLILTAVHENTTIPFFNVATSYFRFIFDLKLITDK